MNRVGWVLRDSIWNLQSGIYNGLAGHSRPPPAPAPNPIFNHQDTKNTKQTEPVSILTLFVSL
jgi:hypothetical protein